MYDNNNYPNDYTNNKNSDVEAANQSSAGEQAGIGYRPYANQNQYQNSYQNSYQNQYQGSGQGEYRSSYQYGNTYPNDFRQMDDKKDKKKEKKTKGVGYLQKALICVSLGLFFGLFAGIGLYIVQAVTGMNLSAKAGEEIVTEQAQEALPEATKDAERGNVDAVSKGDTVRTTNTSTAVVTDVSEVVAEAMPSIVSINNHYTETMSYFGQSMTSEGEASGSGIIVGENDSELLIVTNYHVVEDADKLMVTFVEDSEAEALVKGQDASMDLAVIAVPLADISPSTLSQIAVATLGDSDSLSVGEPAIAIGNSLGYGQSVTTGVISALNRSINLSSNADATFIQTDAAINPGNSGGALLNIKGEVIGINSNKIGGSAVEGMGYAIPISAANPIIAELMLKETKNKVAAEERGYLGISGISVTREVSATYGMPEGVYIAQVYDNTAAQAAGLKKGDIITKLGDETIASMDELQRELEFYAKGDTVDVTVMSADNGGYHSRTVQLTLGDKVQ